MGVLETAGTGQRRLIGLPGGGRGQGRGAEVVDAHLPGPSDARQRRTGNVGVDVHLVQAHAQSVGGADDTYRVADALELAAQGLGLGGGGLEQVHDLERSGGGRLRVGVRTGGPVRGTG